MRKLFISSLFMLALAAFFAVPVPADQSLARFEGGIGSTPLKSGGTPNRSGESAPAVCRG